MTSGSDAQRSRSIPTDPKISAASIQQPGFEFLWKRKLPNDPVQLNSLTPAVLMDRYIGYRGFRSFAFVAGSSNTIWALDSDLNRVEWEAKLSVKAAQSGSMSCPGGLTSPVARATTAEYPVPGTFGGLGGRGGPARSDVGAAGEGAVTIAAALKAASNPGPPRPPGGMRLPGMIYVLASDGMLHTMYVSNGVEPEPPVPFLPANANAEGLVVIDGAAYAATHGCNGAPGGVWALDLASRQVARWRPAKGDIAGTSGPAFGPDGNVYATTTAGDLVALNSKTLALKGSYSTGGQGFTSSPVVFQYKQRNLIAASVADGTIHVLDAATISTAVLKTAPHSAGLKPGELATWQSSSGTRWLLAASPGAAKGAVTAWRLVDRGGQLAIEEGWTSREMASPLPPMIINDVVFALASGEYGSGDASLTAAQRAQKSSPAVLYALDAATGRVLWDSGKTITSFVHSGGLSGGASQLYLATYDGPFYAFGYPIEH
jgi:outer membrane protein assembly factor BamB